MIQYTMSRISLDALTKASDRILRDMKKDYFRIDRTLSYGDSTVTVRDFPLSANVNLHSIANTIWIATNTDIFSWSIRCKIQLGEYMHNYKEQADTNISTIYTNHVYELVDIEFYDAPYEARPYKAKMAHYAHKLPPGTIFQPIDVVASMYD